MILNSWGKKTWAVRQLCASKGLLCWCLRSRYPCGDAIPFWKHWPVSAHPPPCCFSSPFTLNRWQILLQQSCSLQNQLEKATRKEKHFLLVTSTRVGAWILWCTLPPHGTTSHVKPASESGSLLTLSFHFHVNNIPVIDMFPVPMRYSVPPAHQNNDFCSLASSLALTQTSRTLTLSGPPACLTTTGDKAFGQSA